MDIYTRAKRSDIMSRIRSTGTTPELRLYQLTRSLLERRFRIFRNCKRIAGAPDLYIPALSLAFFLDGCFFHGCPIHGHIPKTNTEYWAKKIDRNIRRDARIRRQLRKQGISVWRFWEHELRKSQLERTLARIQLAIHRCESRQRT